MSVALEFEPKAFVLVTLGEQRFAVSAADVAELVAPSRVFRFPHRTATMEGVILRRGRIVPVCEVAELLTGKRLTERRLYLIAMRRYGAKCEWVALPVTGECELISAELMPAAPSDDPHVGGWLSHAGNVIEVVNLEALTPGPLGLAASSRARDAAEARP